MRDVIKIAGVALVAISIIAYLVLQTGPGRAPAAIDTSSYLFRYLATEQSLERACSSLEALDTCSLATKISWLGSKLIGVMGDFGPLLPALITLLLVAFIGYKATNNAFVGGLAALLLATSPSFNYWYKLGNQGPYVFTFLAAIGLYLLYEALRGRWGPLLYVMLFVTAAAMNLLYPASWLIYVLSYFVTAYLFLSNKLERRWVIASSTLLISMLPAIIFFGPGYLNKEVLLGLISLLLSIITSIIGPRALRRSGAKFIWAALAFGIAVLLSAALSSYIPGQEYTIIYWKSYEPANDYGILVVLSLAGFALLTGRESGVDKAWALLLVTSTWLAVLGGYWDTTLSLLASMPMSVLASLTLAKLMELSRKIPLRGKSAVLLKAVAIVLLAGAVLANSAYGFATTGLRPPLYVYDLGPYMGIGEVNITGSPWYDAIKALKADLSRGACDKALLISYWGYTYWIKQLAANSGCQLVSLSDAAGGERGKRYVSYIFTTDELTATETINRLMGEIGARRAYVIVSYFASIRPLGANLSKNVDVGIVYPVESGGYMPQIYYLPAGDVYRLPLYAELAGVPYTKLFNLYVARASAEIPLAWSSAGMETLIPQLITNSLSSLGFTPYNTLASFTSLSSDIRYLRLVNVSYAPVMNVSHIYGSYQVIYVVALYVYER